MTEQGKTNAEFIDALRAFLRLDPMPRGGAGKMRPTKTEFESRGYAAKTNGLAGIRTRPVYTGPICLNRYS